MTSLVGIRCQACRATFFPAADRCPRCATKSVTEVALATHGTVEACTGGDGWSIGEVRLDDGVLVMARLAGEPAPGSVSPAPRSSTSRNACASSSTAVIEAMAWVRAGMCDVALATGVEILSPARGPLAASSPGSGAWVFDTGLTLPAWYALKASRHMSEHGLTREELASVVVKSRHAASLNPLAHFRTPTTVAEVLASPPDTLDKHGDDALHGNGIGTRRGRWLSVSAVSGR